MSKLDSFAVPCKGCGRMIVFARNPLTGKDVPLDPAAHVYRVVEENGKLTAVRIADGALSHFQNCKAAADFSGRNKEVKP